MRYALRATLIGGLVLLAGCADPAPSAIDALRPILLSPEDRLTPETEDEILVYNELGERLGWWSAPGGGGF
jgi:hypothetical protein